MSLVHGIDIIEVERIESMLQEHGDSFLQRCFTDFEQSAANVSSDETRMQRYAGRFAAKEAVMKALGTGWGNGVTWKDISVEGDKGPPVLVLTGVALKKSLEIGISNWIISISHTKSHAIASAIGTGGFNA